MDGILKVTPEKLFSASDEFGSMGTQMNNLTNEMLTLVSNLKSIWQGEANEAYSSKFSSLSSDMDKLYRMVKEHSSDLMEMASAYKEAESANTEQGSGLNSSVVV